MATVIRPAMIADAPGIAGVHWHSHQVWKVTEVRFVR